MAEGTFFPSLPAFTPTSFFAFLFLCLNGSSRHIWYVIICNDIMNIHMSSLGTLVLEGPCCFFVRLFFLQQGVECTEVWHSVFFCSYSDLISHTNIHPYIHKDTAHAGANRLAHPYKYILRPPHSSYLYYMEWIIH